MSSIVPRSSGPSSEAGRLLKVARMLSNVPELNKRRKQIYSLWIMGYLRYLDARDIEEPEPDYINRFLNRLTRKKDLDLDMRQQAAEALVFFHECILGHSVSDVQGRMSMLTREEKQKILSRLSGAEKLLARLIFNTELELTEALRLRVGDVDLVRGQITVSNAAGVSDRFVDLSDDLTVALERHLKRVQETHERDLKEGHGVVDLPPSVQSQFPSSGSAWMWQYVFPAPRRTVDMMSGRERRYPMEPTKLLDALERRTQPMTRIHDTDLSNVPEKSDTQTDEDRDAPVTNNESTWRSVYAS